jgi:hypothetical protein
MSSSTSGLSKRSRSSSLRNESFQERKKALMTGHAQAG